MFVIRSEFGCYLTRVDGKWVYTSEISKAVKFKTIYMAEPYLLATDQIVDTRTITNTIHKTRRTDMNSKLFTAKFSDGKVVTRKSTHEYTHAWRAVWTRAWDGAHMDEHGFTTSEEKARQYAESCHSYVDRKRWVGETLGQRLERVKREEIERDKSIASRVIEIVKL